MISEQYGTVFTKEQYQDIRKVQSIWICPAPAKKRKNGIFKYRTIEQEIYGTSFTQKKDYDLMEVVILNLGDPEEETDLEILNLLNVLFSPTLSPQKKKDILSNDFNIAMTQEFESEVTSMCNLSDGVFELGRQEGRQEGERLGRQEGEELLARLFEKLFALNRTEDAKRVSKDKEYRQLLMKELKII
jgi:hypothetical protein